jgi:hypothetical protein
MTTKTPFIVHCGACKHEWTGFHVPMSFDNVAKVMRNAYCPMCAAGPNKIFCGTAPVDEINTSSKRVKKTGES